jgi:hypothetical protein
MAKRVADEDVQLNEVDAAGRTVPADQTYIVQLHRKDGEWLDVGAVTVPGRTRRTEVLTRAGALEPVVEELKATGKAQVRAIPGDDAKAALLTYTIPEPVVAVTVG